jgi:hypothetical protein
MISKDIHDKTLTLRLNGTEIPLELLVTSLKEFHLFVKNLSQVISPDEEIEWKVQTLPMASGFVISGVGEPESLERILEGFIRVAESLASNQAIPYPENVRKHAVKLTQVINGQIRSIELHTPVKGFIIEKAIEDEAETADTTTTYGMLTGIVDNLQGSDDLGFKLVDDIFGYKITCSVNDEAKRELLRDTWGKRVAVSGGIVREVPSGRVKKVINITRIELLPEVPPDSYHQVRGILPYRGHGEDLIRSIRDAE